MKVFFYKIKDQILYNDFFKLLIQIRKKVVHKNESQYFKMAKIKQTKNHATSTQVALCER